MPPHSRPRVRVSRLLQRLAAGGGERIQVAHLVDNLGDRGLATLMLLLALPNLILLPPGTSAVLGIPLILIATQLAIGRRSLWLPERVRRWSLDRAVFERVIARTGPWLRRAEGFLAPRYGFMFGPVGTRMIGVGCLLLAIILSLPLPIVNFLSGLSISAFALSLLQRDGIFAAIGWAFTLVSAAMTALISGAVWIAGKAILDGLAS